MGISENGDGGGTGAGVDCTVGTIVWVRRRNGSWWPGRILGPEELSASHLMSPRSGTPVKLLGREDASVDWYNLEKSKRVKPFRCGEFDACIERAEASQGAAVKKREKYARREDAILHALDLERKQLQQKLGPISNSIDSKPLGALDRASNFSSNVSLKNKDSRFSGIHSKYALQKTRTLSKKAAFVHQEESFNNSKYVCNGKSDKLIELQEDKSESTPRMRGLQDFGLRIAPKKKLPPSYLWETSTTAARNNIDGFSTVGVASSFGKRKKSGGLTEESLVKKRDRRRPLVQVLRSSEKLKSHHSFRLENDPHVVSMPGEKDNMGLISREKGSEYVYLPTDSTNSLHRGGHSLDETPYLTTPFELDDCPDRPGSLAEENTSSATIGINDSDSSGTECIEADSMEDVEEGEAGLLGDNGLQIASGLMSWSPGHEIPFPSYMSHPHEYSANASAEVGVSKWHMKGKRNVRNLSKRATDTVTSSDKSPGSLGDTAHKMKGSSFKMRETKPSSERNVEWFYHSKKDVNNASDGDDLIDEDFGREDMNGYSNGRHLPALHLTKDHGRRQNYSDLENDSHGIFGPDWEGDEGYQEVQRAFWGDCNSPMYPAHLSKGIRPSLVDVDLKVQASYRGEHVPLVSLMSRLNGKAIIGHPVQVEILEDGFTDQLLSSSYIGLNESAANQPVWRTARRTAMHRVPRSNPITSSLEGEDAGVQESKPSKKYSSHFINQNTLAKKSYFNARQHPSGKKSHKKSLKRVSTPSQKVRTLSSFSSEHMLGCQDANAKLARGSDILDGFIKSEGAMPLITCVPVKVAFSRILEAVGRPSSTVARHVRMASPALSDSS